MRLASRIVVGVACAAVVAGLAAMAVPAFAPLGAVATVANGLVTSLESPAPASSTAPPRRDPAALPEGYIDVGNGTSIPGGGFGDCAAPAFIHIGRQDGQPWQVSLFGDLVDTGVREFATGTAGFTADGRIATYTVAPGDAPEAIGDRFCIWNGLSIPTLNGIPGSTAIQPGDVLVLDPAAVPGFVYHYPYGE